MESHQENSPTPTIETAMEKCLQRFYDKEMPLGLSSQEATRWEMARGKSEALLISCKDFWQNHGTLPLAIENLAEYATDFTHSPGDEILVERQLSSDSTDPYFKVPANYDVHTILRLIGLDFNDYEVINFNQAKTVLANIIKLIHPDTANSDVSAQLNSHQVVLLELLVSLRRCKTLAEIKNINFPPITDLPLVTLQNEVLQIKKNVHAKTPYDYYQMATGQSPILNHSSVPGNLVAGRSNRYPAPATRPNPHKPFWRREA